jgi:hypothetical protein
VSWERGLSPKSYSRRAGGGGGEGVTLWGVYDEASSVSSPMKMPDAVHIAPTPVPTTELSARKAPFLLGNGTAVIQVRSMHIYIYIYIIYIYIYILYTYIYIYIYMLQ